MNSKFQQLTERLQETEKLLSREIDKRKAAEETLKHTRETFKLALKEMPVIILATDDDGSLVFFNSEFEQVGGYDALDMAADPELLQSLFQEGLDELQAEPEAGGEWRFRSKDGSEKTIYWSHVSKYPPMPGWKSWKVGVDITELKAIQARVKVLSGLLPICASCNKIRDDKGYWNRLEGYIHEHSEAHFTHGVCPTCSRKLYPELYEDDT
jgi:PAS domain S-box-containing protein